MSEPLTSLPNKPPAKHGPWFYVLIGAGIGLVVLCVGLFAVGAAVLMITNSTRSTVTETYGTRSSSSAKQIYDVNADAKADIAQALAQAKREHKRVLLDFGADWCPDCVVLAQIFEGDSVKPYLDEHFVVVRINVGQWDANLDVAKKYDDPISKGIPAVVVLSDDEQIVASTRGGELANARTATPQEILTSLQQWAK